MERKGSVLLLSRWVPAALLVLLRLKGEKEAKRETRKAHMCQCACACMCARVLYGLHYIIIDFDVVGNTNTHEHSVKRNTTRAEARGI